MRDKCATVGAPLESHAKLSALSALSPPRPTTEAHSLRSPNLPTSRQKPLSRLLTGLCQVDAGDGFVSNGQRWDARRLTGRAAAGTRPSLLDEPHLADADAVVLVESAGTIEREPGPLVEADRAAVGGVGVDAHWPAAALVQVSDGVPEQSPAQPGADAVGLNVQAVDLGSLASKVRVVGRAAAAKADNAAVVGDHSRCAVGMAAR